MKIFMMVAAALAALFGAALLASPSAFYQPLGLTLTPMLATLGQAHGATLVGVAVINWMSRNARGEAARPVLAGNLVIQVLSLAVAVWTAKLGAGMGMAPAFVIHTALGAGFAWFLWRGARQAAHAS